MEVAPMGVPDRPLVQLPVDDKDENAFDYEPLAPGHIRAFMLYPGTQEEEITIAVFPFDLNDDENNALKCMEALSYTWGNLSPMKRISVLLQNNTSKSLTVTPNLYDALVALRFTTEHRCLWVDQICINQRDNIEKSSQVQLMQFIYSKADQVVVWLSKEIFSSQNLIAHLNMIVMLYQQMTESMRSTSSYKKILTAAGLDTKRSADSSTSNVQEDNSDESGEVQGLDGVSKEAWESVIMVFGHAYFTRVWMIQEIVMAKQCVIMVGGGSIQWAYIERLGQFLQTGSEHFGKFPLPPKLRKNTRCLEKMVTLRTRLRLDFAATGIKWPSHERWSLLDLVRKVWEFDATDLRDKVFSLIGLLSFESHCIPQKIIPDYSSTTTYQQIVWDITVTGLAKDRCLYSLITCHPSRNSSIPSWMLDVANRSDNTMRFPLGISWMRFNASSGSTAVVRKLPSSTDALLFKATCIGTISSLGPAGGLHDAGLSELGADSFSVALSADPIRTSKIITESWEQITGIEISALHSDTPRYEEILRTFSEAFFCRFPMRDKHGEQWTGTAEMDILKLFLEVSMELLPEEDTQILASYLLEPLGRCHGMRMCGGEQQDKPGPGDIDLLIGWVPKEAKIGDVLAVIHGFHIPMLLRRIPGVKRRYRFLGISYVNGFMNGEALKTKGLTTEYMVVG